MRGLRLDSSMTSPRGKHLLHPSVETLRARETCNWHTTRPSCSCLKASCHTGLWPKEAEIELQKTWKILGVFMEVLMTCHGWNNIAQHTAACLKILFSVSVHTPHQPSSCSSCTPFPFRAQPLVHVGLFFVPPIFCPAPHLQISSSFFWKAPSISVCESA